jgi:hypothetical protein
MSDQVVPSNPNANLPDHDRRMQDLLGGIANIANTIAEAGGVASGLPFIGINTSGVWAYGQDRTEVEIGSQWAVDVRTLQHGYIAWPPNTAKERKPLGERMVPANSDLPALSSLPDVGAPYQLQFAFELRCMSGEDEGTVALYKNGSYGAKVLVQSLVEDMRKQWRADQARLCPVVRLQIRSYEHPEWRKTIYNPVLQIVKWISYEDYDLYSDLAEVKVEETAAVEATTPAAVETQAPRAAATGRGRVAQPAAKTPEPAPAPGPARRRPRPQPAA